jgi:hypothetical protein
LQSLHLLALPAAGIGEDFDGVWQRKPRRQATLLLKKRREEENHIYRTRCDNALVD